MARYQVMYWKDFPAQVKAVDNEGGRAKAVLPDRFAESIDAASMAEGSTDSTDYLDGWDWGPEQERDGTAQEVVDALVAEFDQEYPKTRLIEMIKAYKAKQ